MKSIAKRRLIERKSRAERIRKKIFGTAQRPRLAVRRSLNHIYAQIFDDTSGRSIAQIASTSETVRERCASMPKKSKIEVAKIVGELIAKQAIEKGIKTVVFDRKGYLYHGRIKALAESARAQGLIF